MNVGTFESSDDVEQAEKHVLKHLILTLTGFDNRRRLLRMERPVQRHDKFSQKDKTGNSLYLTH